MTKSAFTELPIVDIAPLVAAQSDGADAVAEKLGRAAREVGFCYVTGHGIPDAAFDATARREPAVFRLAARREDEGLYRQFAQPSRLRAGG